jgi:hypothetical protein
MGGSRAEIDKNIHHENKRNNNSEEGPNRRRVYALTGRSSFIKGEKGRLKLQAPVFEGYNICMIERASSNPISLTSADLFRDLSAELLRQGKCIRFPALGRSMYPTIKENEVITVEPIEPSSINVGHIILYRQDRSVVAHRVARIIKTEPPPQFSVDVEHPSNNACPLSLVPRHSFLLRDDTWGKQDVLVTGEQILGKVVSVERNGRHADPYSRRARIRLTAHTIGSRIKRWVVG